MTLQCKLSILLRMDSFAFLVTDAERQVQVLREYSLPAPAMLQAGPTLARLEEVFEEESLLHAPYREVNIALASPLQTLVPEGFFETSAERSYLEQLTRLGEESCVRSEHIPPLGAWNVYAYPERPLAFLQDAFPDARICHLFTPQLISLSGRMEARESPDALFLHLWRGYVEPVVYVGGKMIFINLFPVQHPQDVLYYLLLGCRQAGREPDDLGLCLLGDLADDSALFAELCRLDPEIERLSFQREALPEQGLEEGTLLGFHDLLALEEAFADD